MSYTIQETFTLPSLGKIYNKKVEPQVTLRSMTTEQQMLRLNPDIKKPYKLMCDIIDKCMVNSPGISSYQMCLGDYLFLLYKLRVVTYGSTYKIKTVCPHCGEQNQDDFNIDLLKVKTYTQQIEKYRQFVLPVSEKKIKQTFQKIYMLQDVQKNAKTQQQKDKSKNYGYLYNLLSTIQSVDDEKLDFIQLQSFLRQLPMRDMNMISNYSNKLSNAIGIDPEIKFECNKCGEQYDATFRIAPDFFRPEDID